MQDVLELFPVRNSPIYPLLGPRDIEKLAKLRAKELTVRVFTDNQRSLLDYYSKVIKPFPELDIYNTIEAIKAATGSEIVVIDLGGSKVAMSDLAEDPRIKPHVVNLDQEVVEEIRKRNRRINTHVLDLNFEDQRRNIPKADLIICVSTAPYLVDPIGVMEDAYLSLKEGGIAIFTPLIARDYLVDDGNQAAFDKTLQDSGIGGRFSWDESRDIMSGYVVKGKPFAFTLPVKRVLDIERYRVARTQLLQSPSPAFRDISRVLQDADSNLEIQGYGNFPVSLKCSYKLVP